MPETFTQSIVRKLHSWLPWRRRAGVRALRRVRKPEDVETLIGLLSHPEQEARSAALAALEKIGPPAVPRLMSALADRSLSVRHQAAWVLGRLRKRKLALAVTGALAGDPSGVVGLDQAVGPLATAFLEPSLRPAAAEALVAVGRPAVARLCQLLRSADVGVRVAAAGTLGRIGGARAIHALGQAARSDPNPDTQAAAVRALGAAGEPALGQLVRCLRVPEAPWTLAAETLGEIGAAAVPPLRQESLSTDAHTRRAAAMALGRTGDPRALEPLLRALGDDSEVVCLVAALGLGRLGALAAPAVPALHERRSDARRDVREMAGTAIEMIEDALRSAPAELEASAPPAGRGTEPEAAPRPPV